MATLTGGHRWPRHIGEGKATCFGMIQRSGQVVINLLANVQQKTIEPFMQDTIVPGTRVYTDEYNIYARLSDWGYDHKSVRHGRGECARDDNGFCEVHVHTMEGFWSLWSSWLRPYRGIAQEKLPLYLGSVSLCTTCASEAKRCWAHSLSYLSHKTPGIQ